MTKSEGSDRAKATTPSKWPRVSAIWKMLRDAYTAFDADDGTLLAGGIAFYAVLSIAPMLVIALAVAGAVLGDDAASGVLSAKLTQVLGERAAELLADVVEQSRPSTVGSVAMLLSLALTVYASTRLFVQLQVSLNRIWGLARPDAPNLKARVRAVVRERVLSFVLVLFLGAVLTATVAMKSVLASIALFLALPRVPLLWRVTDLVLSLSALTATITLVYRFLPQVRIPWGHALRGAAFTAVLVGVGSQVVGLYLEMAGAASAFGAAGALAVVMLAAYYSAQIFLFGAELTGLYAARGGAPLTPMKEP